MAGRIQWEAQVDSNVAKLLSETKELRDQLDGIKKGNYEIKLNIDDKKLEKVIFNLDKMLESLGKGTGDFKEFENLSKQLNEIVSEVKELNKAFGGINDSGVSNLLSSIQSIDKSLSSLSEHITNVNKDFGSVGKNASDNVGQINEARKATEGLTEATKELANAQKNVGNKSNISLGKQTEILSSNTTPLAQVETQLEKVENQARDTMMSMEELYKVLKQDTDADKELFALGNSSTGRFTLPNIGTDYDFISEKLIYSAIDNCKEQIDSLIHTHSEKIAAFSPDDIYAAIEEMNKGIVHQYVKGIDEVTHIDFSQLSQKQWGLIARKFEDRFEHLVETDGWYEDEEVSQEVKDAFQQKMKNLLENIIAGYIPNGKTLDSVVGTSQLVNQNSLSSTPIKDTFQGDTEAPKMEEVATATAEAVQAKKDFATANEGVQDSVDGSKSKLELETELMERLAKSAREAADAKKEFVEANKQVQCSVDDTGKSVKKDKYKDKSKISEDEYTGKSDYYASIANQKLKNSGNTILGETVSTELVDGLVKVTAKIKTADDTWKTFSAKIDADGNMFEQRFRTITKGVDKLETELKNFGLDTNPALTYGETLKKAEEIRSSLKLDDSYTIKVDSNELVTITQKLSDVESSTTSVTQTFKSAQDAIEHFGKEASSSAEKTTVALKGVKASAESAGEAVDESASHLDKIGTKLDKYRKDFNNFSAVPDADHRFASFETQLNGLNVAISKLEAHQNALKDKGFVDEADINETKRLSTEIDNLIEKIKKVPQSKRGYKDVAVSKMAEKIASILEQHPRLAKKAKTEIQGYYNELASGNPTRPLDEILDRVNKIIQGQREAGRTGKGFIDILSDKALYGQAAQLAGYYLSLTDFIRYGQQGIQIIRELDTALTEMRKVSSESISTLKEFQGVSFDIADTIGTTAKQIQNSTADWMRLGYSISEASALAENSNIYKNVGDMEINEATEHMVSSVQAWKSEFNDNVIETSEAVINRYNKIGNEFAISSADIGEAMETSAAALKAGGNSLNESLGLLTAGNIIQQDASTTSAALKILSLRIRGRVMPPCMVTYALCY